MSIPEELIPHYPHDGPAYESDNTRVYVLPSLIFSGKSKIASIARYQRVQNGRDAYLDLVTYNMGPSNGEIPLKIQREYSIAEFGIV